MLLKLPLPLEFWKCSKQAMHSLIKYKNVLRQTFFFSTTFNTFSYKITIALSSHALKIVKWVAVSLSLLEFQRVFFFVTSKCCLTVDEFAHTPEKKQQHISSYTNTKSQLLCTSIRYKVHVRNVQFPGKHIIIIYSKHVFKC